MYRSCRSRSFSLDTQELLHILSPFRKSAAMLVQLEEIREHGVSREYRIEPHALPELVAAEAAGEQRFIAPLLVEVTLSRIGGMIEVFGRLTTQVGYECGRCLKSFEHPLNAIFEVTFTNEPPEIQAEDEDGEGIELTAEDLGLIPFEGNSIDLTEVVQEQFLLALPIRPLCSETCRGLCPQCGQDLNSGKCNCVLPEFGNKFSALKNLKLDR